VLGDVAQPQWFGPVDDQAEQPVTARQVTDGVPLLLREPVRDERLQPAARPRAEHPQGGVLGVRELAGGLHDAMQHAVQRQVAGDRDDGVEQKRQPVLPVDDLADAVQELTEQVVEARSGEGRQSGRRTRGAHAASSSLIGGHE
jgi:hypothetical protein